MLHHVLFIGNSHTYYNYMPQMLSMLVKSENRGFELTIDQCTGEGAGLEWHWKNVTTRNAIAEKPWDSIVLQDRSGGPLEDPESFKKYAGLLDKEIRMQGASTLLFMTWANRSRPDTQKVLTHAYRMTAHRLQAHLAPVGLAWEAARRMDPKIELYHRDSRHASPTGSYLAACVFYSVVFKTSPEGLPGSFYFKGKMWVDLEKERASLLQKMAWKTVSNLHPFRAHTLTT